MGAPTLILTHFGIPQCARRAFWNGWDFGDSSSKWLVHVVQRPDDTSPQTAQLLHGLWSQAQRQTGIQRVVPGTRHVTPPMCDSVPLQGSRPGLPVSRTAQHCSLSSSWCVPSAVTHITTHVTSQLCKPSSMYLTFLYLSIRLTLLPLSISLYKRASLPNSCTVDQTLRKSLRLEEPPGCPVTSQRVLCSLLPTHASHTCSSPASILTVSTQSQEQASLLLANVLVPLTTAATRSAQVQTLRAFKMTSDPQKLIHLHRGRQAPAAVENHSCDRHPLEKLSPF